MAGLLLGVDGGGSSTEVVVARPAGGELAAVAGGPSNRPAPEAIAALDSAIDLALRNAGTLDGQVAAIGAGIAGLSDATRRRAIKGWFAARFPGALICVTTDAELVLRAATDGAGIAVIAGTGSIAIGRAPDGGLARAGGRGPTIGDPGSGLAIARAALEAVARATDGTGPATSLSAALGTSWPMPAAGALPDPAADRPASDVAALVPIVDACAAAGDAVARDILDAAGRDLAALVIDLVASSGLRPATIAIAGGVLLHVDLVAHSFVSAVRTALGPAILFTRVERPVEGALRLAAGLLTERGR